MDPAQLKQMEALCDMMFSPTATTAQKNHAQSALMVLGSSAKFIPQCQGILDTSTNQYALYLAATSLTKLISEHWNNFTEEQRVDIRACVGMCLPCAASRRCQCYRVPPRSHLPCFGTGNYILTYLARKGTSLETFVITALIQLLCRITKLGWFDSSGALRKIVQQTTTFLQESVQHCIIGLKILNELVVEFNHVSAKRTVSVHRKVAVSFRDLSLYFTFEIGSWLLCGAWPIVRAAAHAFCGACRLDHAAANHSRQHRRERPHTGGPGAGQLLEAGHQLPELRLHRHQP